MYQDKCYIRHEEIDGVSGWLWPIGESGAWEGPSVEWYEHKALWYSHVKKFDVCIQAGGCMGMYPRLHAKYFKRVYTFEPNPFSFFILNNNCQLPNIYKFNAALGSTEDLVGLNMSDSKNMGTHTITGNEKHIPIISLDNLCKNWDTIDFIQLDVECYERAVIEGAKKIISKFRPAISAELGEGLIDILGPLGYKRVGKTGADTLFVAT